MAKDVTPGRCLNCKAEVQVPNLFADGDTVQCAVCRMSLKILRKPALRLIIADVGPLRDEMRFAQQRIGTLEHELARAHASFGIGANGLGLGLLYVIAQIGLEDQVISRELIMEAAGVALVTGILLELANYLFLAKRREMSRISGDIAELQKSVKELQRKIRESAKR
jgi:hypothetical protein